MSLHPFCDPYVWESPNVLRVTGFTVKKHKEGVCVSEYVNHIVFIYLLFLIAGIVVTLGFRTPHGMAVFFGFATLYCLPTFAYLVTSQNAKEGFRDADTGKSEHAGEVYEVIGMGAAPATLTLPNARNPFMNVLIDEIKYNPTRPKALSVFDPSVKITLDDYFRTEFYSDPTDVFGKTHGQRQFVTMPSTSIPNDVDAYQNWLYRIPGKTCKEGGREACLPGTDGGALPWLNSNP